MSDIRRLRRACAERRSAYQHAKLIYGEAPRLGLQAYSDMTALTSELQDSLVAYYAAHSALHDAMKRTGAPFQPLRTALN